MTPPPRLLLVDDEPVTRAFMADALRALPADVSEAADIAAAVAAERTAPHALWLCDAHLPDGDGVALLAALRALAPATPALAHTASTDRAVLDALAAAGYGEVLVKPLSADMLQAAARRTLGMAAPPPPPPPGKAPVWDDDQALRALSGNIAHVGALRALFRTELPGVRDAVASAAAAGDAPALRAHLHRLCASCGFVGAARLDRAVRALQARTGDRDALDAFLHAADDTLAALDAPD